MKKPAHMKYKVVRSKRRLQEFTFGTFNVSRAACKGINGIGLVDALMRIYAEKGCDVIGL